MISHDYFMDKETMRQIGQALWELRRDKRLQLHHVSTQAKIPENILERMEIGRNMPYGTLRKLLNFYGKSIRISIE